MSKRKPKSKFWHNKSAVIGQIRSAGGHVQDTDSLHWIAECHAGMFNLLPPIDSNAAYQYINVISQHIHNLDNLRNRHRPLWKTAVKKNSHQQEISTGRVLPNLTRTLVTKPKSHKSRPKKLKSSIDPNSAEFLESWGWKRARFQVLRFYEETCMQCGRSRERHGVILHVDHIKSRYHHPELALDFDNLQVLCEDCNYGKGRDEVDFRKNSKVYLHWRNQKHA